MKIGALGPSKNSVFHWRVCKYHYVHLSPKGSQNVTKILPKMEPESIKYGFRSILKTSGKNNQRQCRKLEEMGVQRKPNSVPKSVKKGPQNTLSLLWVPLGAQGVPGITFWWIFLHLLLILERFLVDVGGDRLYILGIFSIMHYHSLRHFPVPLVTTGSGKCLSDTGGSVYRVPFRESREGESPRGGAE